MSHADSVREIMTENETSQQLCLKHTHTHTKLMNIFFKSLCTKTAYVCIKMHISHCSTLKITPITDLCLRQSDKKKGALMHLQSGLAHILAARWNKTMRGEGKRNKEGARFIFHLQLFCCCCFLEGRRGKGRRVRMELYVEVESATASSLQQPSTSRGRKKQDTGAHVHRSHLWLAERSVRAEAVLQKTSFLYFLPSCSYCSTPLFRHPSRCSDSPLWTVYPSLLALVLASLVNFLSSVFVLPRLFYITCFIFLSDFLTFCSLGISQSSQSLFLIS